MYDTAPPDFLFPYLSTGVSHRFLQQFVTLQQPTTPVKIYSHALDLGFSEHLQTSMH